jgi:hypothetical protein
MNSITIGSAERSLADADTAWIKHAFDNHARVGIPCVRVVIHSTDMNVVLQTVNCSRGGGGGRRPNVHELKVLELWGMEGLNDPHYTIRGVVDFVERVKRLIR